MAGSEIDYNEFQAFFMNVPQAAGEQGGQAATAMAAPQVAGPIVGSVGTDTAMRFGTIHRKALREMQSFLSDAAIGQIALANAVACAGIAYHDGDMGQKEAMDTISNILYPQGSKGTVRGGMQPPKSDDGGGKDGKNGDQTSPDAQLPGAKLDPNGNLVDAKGNVLVYANGKPNISNLPKGGNSTYQQYLNQIRAAQNLYGASWSGLSEKEWDRYMKDKQSGAFKPEDDPLGAKEDDTKESLDDLKDSKGNQVTKPGWDGDKPPTAPKPEPKNQEMPSVYTP